MKQCPDNEINASFIDISRIKWLVFFYWCCLSSAQLVPLQAPKHRLIIGPHPVEQTAFRRDIKDNGYKSVFTNLWLERQRNRSWIKGLGKNPHKSELIHWRQCLLLNYCLFITRYYYRYYYIILLMLSDTDDLQADNSVEATSHQPTDASCIVFDKYVCQVKTYTPL